MQKKKRKEKGVLSSHLAPLFLFQHIVLKLWRFFFAVLSAVGAVSKEGSGQYYGSYIGSISNQDKGISGQFYCIDQSTVYLRNFTYTGTGSVNIFVYAGTLGSDGGYTKTGYPLRNVKGT